MVGCSLFLEFIMRKVYILNDGGHDYSAAEEFGKLVYCSKGLLNKHDIHQMFRMLTDALADAQADDCIIFSSLGTLCSVATAIMVEKFGEVHFLIFNNNAYKEYTLVTCARE